jgi:hypothetical protein
LPSTLRVGNNLLKPSYSTLKFNSLLVREVCAKWQKFMVDGSMLLQVGMTTASALK